jgi:putative endonuclease
MKEQFYVYILAKAKNSTLYTGVTNNLVRRVYEHKNGLAEGFTKEYGIKILVYYEVFDSILDAIQREKNIKKWKRCIKVKYIEFKNPNWNDLYDKIL